MNKNLMIFIFKIIPTSLLSRLFGYIARMPIPRLVLNFIITWYCKKYTVKDEFIWPENGFKNLDSFFTRKLKSGIHKIDKSKSSIVSPVDAVISLYGDIKDSKIIQAKGIDYSLFDLIPSKIAEKFIDGKVMTLYLSPGDYHRIHSPVSGKITGFFNIPGKLFTVQEYMVNGLKGLFSKNERIISYIETKNGYVAVCKIGAMNVGRISLSYNNSITNTAFRRKNEYFYPKADMPVIKKGEELGIFHLGSTIILLFQKNKIKFSNIKLGTKIRVGEKIGTFK